MKLSPDRDPHTGSGIRRGDPGDIAAVLDIDSDASKLFIEAGLDVELGDGHEFSIMERTRWLASLSSDNAFVAFDERRVRVGFAATGHLDGEMYLIQLSVRPSHMRRGIGTALLGACERLAIDRRNDLWLTTYAHLAWNQPFYEHRGFDVVPPEQVGREMAAELAYERRWLPDPHRRVAMRKLLRSR